jgi:hypothetical protein
VGFTVEQITAGVDGAAVGAYVNDDGKRFDDIELICRSGSKLESFIARKPSPARVAPLRPNDAIARANRWQQGYPEEAA